MTARRAGTGRAGMGSQRPVAGQPGPQVLILHNFPSVDQVRLLGPNTGTVNRYALNRIRQQVQSCVAVEARQQGLRPMLPPVQVTLRYVFSDARHRDDGNFSLVAKPVLDALVRGGWLQGDNHARLRERVEFVVEKRARRLEVILIPAPTPAAAPSAEGED